MEHTYIDIQAIIAQANQKRSDAFGEWLALAWSHLKVQLSRLAAQVSAQTRSVKLSRLTVAQTHQYLP
ncbi:hypothetical protein GALL_340120 [mine drainage metagenome]|uniref:Uncharacterized protein n=1 Tax=mine drainage metagenome TaxID=410659 RepID=A0A1J5QL00_9ZZZZ